MASIEATVSTLSVYNSMPTSSIFKLCPKTRTSVSLRISTSLPLSLRLASCPLPSVVRSYPLNLVPTYDFPYLPRCTTAAGDVAVVENLEQAAAGDVAVVEISEQGQDAILKKKLYVVNLPWNLPREEIKKKFGECGTVKDVEMIRDKNGKSRGYAFVTMGSGEEAQAAIDKFNLKELSGRTIKVEFAKSLKKPRTSPPAAVVPTRETRHKLYVSNLQWKVRSTHLRELFSAEFKPVSARVVFSNPEGSSAGYGFVSFATREEAEAALSACDGKELLGRPIRITFSEKTSDELGQGEKTSDESGQEKGDAEETPTNLEDAEQEVEGLEGQPKQS